MLLFDANLSPRLVELLAADYPGSRHVESISLTATDRAIWSASLQFGLTIVTKDADFESLALVKAPPGKVILVGLGNCSTPRVEKLIRINRARIAAFLSSETECLLRLP